MVEIYLKAYKLKLLEIGSRLVSINKAYDLRNRALTNEDLLLLDTAVIMPLFCVSKDCQQIFKIRRKLKKYYSRMDLDLMRVQSIMLGMKDPEAYLRHRGFERA